MREIGPGELDPYQQGCPTRRILDLIGGRWTVLIVGALGSATLRFSDLLRRVDGISQKMLTQTLRALERDGLVIRTVTAEVPVKVEYRLSAAGLTLTEPLKALELWSIDHFAGIMAARRDHEIPDST
ncbi:winged helix-turn-helix transcriptional regulator [Herbiconiux ginsengi]|uniref:Transcriptional regulator, HxlR family n=1 Tax=Herbiconiux ginsengi TaxID=381665 RepID=A0A1H3KYS7_9MICO|nr:helix-turn-helix domain-containing protein [Herbiconiux ginsengi]SDY57311.1 transcriptional regulator, HxlR family [Herbiconiux ginsengi]